MLWGRTLRLGLVFASMIRILLWLYFTKNPGVVKDFLNYFVVGGLLKWIIGQYFYVFFYGPKRIIVRKGAIYNVVICDILRNAPLFIDLYYAKNVVHMKALLFRGIF